MRCVARLIAWTFVIGGCGVPPGNPGTEAAGPRPEVRADTSIGLRIVSPDQVRSGSILPLVLEVANVGTDTATLELGGNPVLFDFLVFEAPGGELIWNWRTGRSDTIQAILLFRTLEPKEVITYQGEWHLRDLRGRAVAPGRYYVLGRVPSGGSRFYESPRKPLTILP